MYKVKEVAQMVGISVRTLHHYDRINLLKPQTVTGAGYRLYSDNELEILQHILFLKELDFSLKEIQDIIWSPGFDRERALIEQRILLLEKRLRLDQIIATLDKTIASRKDGLKMEKDEMFKAFDVKDIESHQKKYAAEVKEKYGSSSAYKESDEKTGKYSKEDWAKVMNEGNAIMKALAGNRDKPADDPVVQQLIAKWQQHITDCYYTCTDEILGGLGESYVDDERFAKNIDKHGEGLAAFFRDAIRVYCRN